MQSAQLLAQVTVTGGAAFATAAALAAGVTWRFAHSIIHPPRAPLWRTPDEFALPYENVKVLTSDGLRIAGWLIPGSSDAALVLAHGQARNRSDVLGVARLLHRAGYTTLAIDHRACGESDGRVETFGIRESEDIIAAAEYLARLDGINPGRVGALGWSMGAASALLAAGRSPAIRAVVADSPFACLEQLVGENFRRLVGLPRIPFGPLFVRFAELQAGVSRKLARPVDAMPRIAPRPVMLIHGTADEIVSYRHSQMLVEAAAGPISAWFPEGVHHVRAVESYPEEYYGRVSAFLADSFGQSPDDRAGERQLALDNRVDR